MWLILRVFLCSHLIVCATYNFQSFKESVNNNEGMNIMNWKKLQKIKLRCPDYLWSWKSGKQQHHCGLKRNQEEIIPRVKNKCCIAIFTKRIHIQANINSYIPSNITPKPVRYNKRSNRKVTKSQMKSSIYLEFLNS